MTTKITSINTAGMRNRQRRRQILDNIWNSGNDITFLQETHITPDLYDETKQLWPGKILFSPGKENTDGTAICFRDKNAITNNTITDQNGNYQILDTDINGHKLTLTNIYALSGGNIKRQKERETLWKKISDTLKDNTTPDIIHVLAGDFNMTEKSQDRAPRNDQTQTCKSQTSLDALKDLLNIEDIFRKQHPTTQQFTHLHQKTTTRTRIDRIYTSKSIGHLITKSALLPTTMTDHYTAPHITITFNKQTRGKGLWVMNNKLLHDTEYITLITTAIEKQKTKKAQFRDIPEWWENTKLVLKQKTIKYAKALANNNQKYEKYLRKRLKNTLKKEERLGRDNKISQQLKAKIEEIEKRREEGARVRTKTEWNSEGERNTKLFYSLEKQKTAKHTITQLTNKTGKLKDQQEDILDIMREFYATLYKNEKLDEAKQDEILRKTKTPRLSANMKDACDENLTELEITVALKNTKNGRSPGSDGLSPEFYKKFWGQLAKDFTDMTNTVLNRKLLTPTQRQAVLICIYKNGDRNDISNWRPISLLNTDYKLITKTLTNRIKPTLQHIISKYQTACVPNRQMHMNLYYTRDILKIAQTEKLRDLCIVAIDQIKAFDRVCWKYLTKVLNKYNYGTGIIENIMTLYTGLQTIIKANGYMAAPFQPSRGVRQGSPLSMTLYILQADILIRHVEQSRDIRGITINKEETKITAYADDTLFYITGLDSLTKLNAQLENFEHATGTKLNRKKCQGSWIGKNNLTTKGPLNFNWKEPHLKTLGITFKNDGRDQTQQNWSPIIQKM